MHKLNAVDPCLSRKYLCFEYFIFHYIFNQNVIETWCNVIFKITFQIRLKFLVLSILSLKELQLKYPIKVSLTI